MVGMYAAGTTYEVTGKGFDPEASLAFRKDGSAHLGKRHRLYTSVHLCFSFPSFILQRSDWQRDACRWQGRQE